MTTALEQNAVALEVPSSALLASVTNPDAIRVLLIEDGVIDCGFLANELSTQGFVVRTVADSAALLGAPDAAHDAGVDRDSRASEASVPVPRLPDARQQILSRNLSPRG
jgi:hypothetical protein